jgi:hypothetical protein
MCLKLLVLPRAQTLESHIHDGSGGAGVSGVHGWGWRACDETTVLCGGLVDEIGAQPSPGFPYLG